MILSHTFKKYILENIQTIVTFLTIGLLSAGVYFLAFTLFWKVLGINYKISISISYIFSIIFHFTANRKFTFKSHGKNFFQHVSKYLVMILINYVITLIVVQLVVETLRLSPYLGIIFSIGATVNTGYLMSRYWIFYSAIKEIN